MKTGLLKEKLLKKIDKLEKELLAIGGKLAMDINNLELKPCPFCGGRAIILSHPGQNWDGKEGKHINIGACHGLWYVGCPHEYFEVGDLVPHCEIHPSAQWYARLEDAIYHWNTHKKPIEAKKKK